MKNKKEKKKVSKQPQINYEHRIAHIPPTARYNGILIILREPNDPYNKYDDEFLEGNSLWFQDVIAGKTSTEKYLHDSLRNRSIGRYGNRFREMLEIVSYEKPLKLDDVVYANISFIGGKEKIGPEYAHVDKLSRLQEITDYLSANGYVTKIAFVCKDLFREIIQKPGKEVIVGNGIKYTNGKRMRTAVWNGIHFYEIIHPARCPGIITSSD